MDDPARLLAAIGFAVAMSASPGPNNVMVAASAAVFGIRRTLPHILGVAIGFPAMLVAIAAGLAEALAAVPALAPALRWLGGAWLLWLAWRMAAAAWPAPVPGAVPGPAKGGGRAPARALTALEAAAFQWVNPKAWLIALAAIGTHAGDPVLPGALGLAALFAVAALASLLGWAALGAAAARALPPRFRPWVALGMAATLALSVLPVLVG
jgi:threonine/homoserine/homoserine lactone efflux protein